MFFNKIKSLIVLILDVVVNECIYCGNIVLKIYNC